MIVPKHDLVDRWSGSTLKELNRSYKLIRRVLLNWIWR